MGDELDGQLGRRLRHRRLLLGFSQARIARACGISFQQIQKYECGASRISAVRLWQIAKALSVPLTYFFEGLDGAQRGLAVIPRKQADETASRLRRSELEAANRPQTPPVVRRPRGR